MEFISVYCMGLFSTSGFDPEPEVERFPIFSYMFHGPWKKYLGGGERAKVDTCLLRTPRVNCIHSQNFIRIASRILEEVGHKFFQRHT